MARRTGRGTRDVLLPPGRAAVTRRRDDERFCAAADERAVADVDVPEEGARSALSAQICSLSANCVLLADLRRDHRRASRCSCCCSWPRPRCPHARLRLPRCPSPVPAPQSPARATPGCARAPPPRRARPASHLRRRGRPGSSRSGSRSRDASRSPTRTRRCGNRPKRDGRVAVGDEAVLVVPGQRSDRAHLRCSIRALQPV